jgi:hypothetical protein
MKTKLMLLSLMLISTLSFSQNVIRVLNGQNIQTLIDAPTFVSGSILLLDPGSYGDVIVKKRVSFIGGGYFNATSSATFGDLTFTDDNLGSSASSFVTGCNISRIYIKTNNILVSQCRVYGTNGYANGISISNKTNGAIVKQCYVVNNIITDGAPTNFQIINNIVAGQIFLYINGASISGIIRNNSLIGLNAECTPLSISNDFNNGIVISNNIFITPTSCNNASGQQNYLTNYFAKFNNNIVRQGNYRSNDPSNKFLNDADMAKVVFTATGTSADGQYILNTNSPAKSAGEGGTDCGAFGGTEPYIIGGLPIGPVITDLQVPSTARQNETIQIKLKAKVQN